MSFVHECDKNKEKIPCGTYLRSIAKYYPVGFGLFVNDNKLTKKVSAKPYTTKELTYSIVVNLTLVHLTVN